LWKEHIALKDRLVFSFKKYNFQRIVDAFTHCLSFFYLFVKEFMGICKGVYGNLLALPSGKRQEEQISPRWPEV